MGLREIALDFSLLRQGLTIEHEFGPAALAELVRVGRFLEHAFYEAGSLRETDRGIVFALVNPPLRLGAFRALRLLVDGHPVPPERCAWSEEGNPVQRRFSEIDPLHPIVLAPGRPIRFEVEVDRPRPGRHVLRLEFQSVAIPPLVWIEIYDSVRTRGP
jgi:hypothetical protein